MVMFANSNLEVSCIQSGVIKEGLSSVYKCYKNPLINGTLEHDNLAYNLEYEELNVEGVFVEIGFIPNQVLSKQLNLKTEEGYIITDKKQKTNVPGVFAAGDITNNSLKQVITAAAEGAIAATAAHKEIKKGD